MCFRPASASLSLVCPNCGKKVSAVSGLVPKNCPFCKASLESVEVSENSGANVASADLSTPAPSAKPMAPKAPQAPQSKAAPKVEDR